MRSQVKRVYTLTRSLSFGSWSLTSKANFFDILKNMPFLCFHIDFQWLFFFLSILGKCIRDESCWGGITTTSPRDPQWCSQNAEKVTHIKGRPIDQAMILFNCIPFQMGTSLKGKNLLPEEANSFLYEQFLILWKNTFYHYNWPPLNVTIFIMHVRNLRNEC